MYQIKYLLLILLKLLPLLLLFLLFLDKVGELEQKIEELLDHSDMTPEELADLLNEDIDSVLHFLHKKQHISVLIRRRWNI